MAISSEKTSRILTRGEDANFKVAFYADAAKTQPLVPLNSSYPQYVIYDLGGVAIQSGVGTMLSSGQYTAPFMVPKDAALSYFDQRPQTYNDQSQGLDLTANHSGRYRVEWLMVTEDTHQVTFVEEFDVKDIAVTKSHSREQKYLVISGKETTISYRVTEIPAKAKVQLFIRGQEIDPQIEATLDTTTDPYTGTLKVAKDGDSYVLYYDVPAGTTHCNTAYVVLWEIQDKVFAPPVHEYQIMTAITTTVLPIITGLRMLIDKYQIRIGRTQAYEDSDLLEYLAMGMRYVNATYPTTGYQITTMPDDLLYFSTVAAAVYGLNAQQLLNAQLNFNFSGQNVTLSVDNGAAIDGVISRLTEQMTSALAAAKMTYVRKERGMGTVGTRGVGYNRASTMVFRVGTGNSPNMGNWLVKIGLL